jgi:hypothetical protein
VPGGRFIPFYEQRSSQITLSHQKRAAQIDAKGQKGTSYLYCHSEFVC